MIEQNRPYQTSDLLQKNETHFPRCVGQKPVSQSTIAPISLTLDPNEMYEYRFSRVHWNN